MLVNSIDTDLVDVCEVNDGKGVNDEDMDSDKYTDVVKVVISVDTTGEVVEVADGDTSDVGSKFKLIVDVAKLENKN